MKFYLNLLRILASLPLLSLCACSRLEWRDISKFPPSGVLPRAEISAVPFFTQEKYQCGPASLAMVLSANGTPVTPQELVDEMYTPLSRGTFPTELLSAARRRGQLAYMVHPEMAALFLEISAGHPVVVLQNLGLSWFPVWHYSVVIGYDLNSGTITSHSGAEAKEKISLSLFERCWQRAGKWAMLALRPGELPATAQREEYLRAAVGLELVKRWAEARHAYSAGLKKWPADLRLSIGLANALYGDGSRAEAISVLSRVTLDHPDSVIAHNNLAHILAAQGDLHQALKHAEVAVSLGGEFAPAARKTHGEISRLLAMKALHTYRLQRTLPQNCC